MRIKNHDGMGSISPVHILGTDLILSPPASSNGGSDGSSGGDDSFGNGDTPPSSGDGTGSGRAGAAPFGAFGPSPAASGDVGLGCLSSNGSISATGNNSAPRDYGPVGRAAASGPPRPPMPSCAENDLPGIKALFPVLFGPYVGQIVPPTARGGPITSRPSHVDFNLDNGFVEINVKGLNNEAAFFRVPLQRFFNFYIKK